MAYFVSKDLNKQASLAIKLEKQFDIPRGYIDPFNAKFSFCPYCISYSVSDTEDSDSNDRVLKCEECETVLADITEYPYNTLSTKDIAGYQLDKLMILNCSADKFKDIITKIQEKKFLNLKFIDRKVKGC